MMYTRGSHGRLNGALESSVIRIGSTFKQVIVVYVCTVHVDRGIFQSVSPTRYKPSPWHHIVESHKLYLSLAFGNDEVKVEQHHAHPEHCSTCSTAKKTCHSSRIMPAT